MKMYTKNKQKLPPSNFFPYPELVEPHHSDGGWTVMDSNDYPELPSNGVTNKVSKQLFMPAEAGGIGVGLHELAHVKWSPLRFPRVPYPLVVLQAVEDARINLGLAYLGMPMTLDRLSMARIGHRAAHEAKHGRLAEGILRGIASLGTQAESTMREELDALSPYAARLARYWIDQAETRLVRAREAMGPGKPVAPFKVARQIASDLARDLEKHGLLHDDLAVSGVGCCVTECADADEGGGGRRRGFLGRHRADFDSWLKGNRSRREHDEAVEPGRMTVSRPALTVRQPRVLRGGLGGRRASTEGAHIVRPDRLLLDGAIFGRRSRHGGGTILIDTSGSMSLSVDEVESLVTVAGGQARVAIYSGSGREGELRIVAQADWRAKNEHFVRYGTGNIVDLPALEWLAKQSEPRWWVSDLGVTGVGDQPCAAIDEACAAVVERGRIRHAQDVEAFLEEAH